MDKRKLIEDMTDEEARFRCHLIVGLHWDDSCFGGQPVSNETLTGHILKCVKQWNASFSMNMNGQVRISIVNYPQEWEIVGYSIQKCFLQTAVALGHWNLLEPATETPKP